MIITHRLFNSDVTVVSDWYEAERAGLGELFVEAVAATLRQIDTRPRTFPLVGKKRRIRRAIVPRFPYAIYYRAARQDALVVTVMHMARSQRAIQRMVSARDRNP